eukprot:12333829-Ditylum_brightwellii.AAC.2
MGLLVVEDDVGELGIGDIRWAFGNDWQQGEVGHCIDASVGIPAVMGARAEPPSCPDSWKGERA